MRELRAQLRHRIAIINPLPTLPNISRSFIASPKAMQSRNDKPKCWVRTVNAAPLLQPTGSTSRRSVAEKHKCARRLMLRIAGLQACKYCRDRHRSRFGDAAEWHFFDIDYLITKTAIDKYLQQRRALFPGKSTVVIEDMHAGSGIPLLIQHQLRDIRR